MINDNKDKYFYRNVIYSKVANTISIIDLDDPDKERKDLEPWFGIIFQLADGQHTVEELYNLLARKYTEGPPKDLLKTVVSVVDRMVELNIVVVTDVKTELPYYLSMPYEMMDVDKAKQLLAEDEANHK